MKTIILLLILAAFLQSSIVPLNLVLIILICRAYIRPEKENLILAFALGLLTAHLSLSNLGIQSLVFLILIYLAQIFSKTRFSSHSLLIMPLSFILLSLYSLIDSITIGRSVRIFPGSLPESIVALVVFYLIRLWEERFIVQKEIKLKF